MARVVLAAATAVLVVTAISVATRDDPTAVTGSVVDSAGVGISGAIVRAQATTVATVTDDTGRFELEVGDNRVGISAWTPGYFVGGGDVHEPGDDVEVTLVPLPEGDFSEYEWVSADAPGGKEAGACSACHSNAGTEIGFALPADEWHQDAHGRSAANVRFLTMYGGTDVAGNQSPPTRYRTNRDYGDVPMAPDPNAAYFGPGYVLDFPDTAGNCASCHTPMASADDAYGVDPRTLDGVAAEGVGCDYCHKVSEVIVGEDGMPWPGRPGVLSIDLARPPEGHQFFAGPFDDVAPGDDTFSPLQLESRFCAACHHAVFWDTVVYDSYGEWLRSDYSDPETGKTCQNCHMPTTGATLFALPEEGGLQRDPATIASHLMPGAADEELLRTALDMAVAADRNTGTISLEVTVSNDKTGHHVPTDSPLRHVILLVKATDETGESLELEAGPLLPDWCGVGDPSAGYYAGQPGTAYAKILEELWTEVSPTASYWNPTRVHSDNRIAAHESDTTTYSFVAPQSGAVEVNVRLLFRRAFIELADQKGWGDEDIVMADTSLTLLP